MADNGVLAFARAVIGGTAVEQGATIQAAFSRLASAITSVSTAGTVTWTTSPVAPFENAVAGATLLASGTSTVVCSTSPTALTYTMPLPTVAGVRKTIANVTSTTSGTATITMATGGRFNGAAAGTVITLTSSAGIELVATTTSQWGVLAISANATIA